MVFRSKCPRQAFTLIELTVVITISTLMIATVALLLRAPVRIARWQASVEAVRLADAQIRAACRIRGNHGTLEIDSETQTVIWYMENETDRRHESALFGVNKIRTPQGDTTHFRTIVDRWGRAETYCVHIGAPTKGRWLVFSGVSGQVTSIENDESISFVLQQISKSPLAY